MKCLKGRGGGGRGGLMRPAGFVPPGEPKSPGKICPGSQWRRAGRTPSARAMKCEQFPGFFRDSQRCSKHPSQNLAGIFQSSQDSPGIPAGIAEHLTRIFERRIFSPPIPRRCHTIKSIGNQLTVDERCQIYGSIPTESLSSRPIIQ